MSIPVLICPCISRFDMLERMLRSIDHPVDKIVIIDNSCANYVVPEDLRHLPVEYIRPIINIGYGGGINDGISQTPHAPWWIFCNADVFFGPGALAKVDEAMVETEEPLFVASQTVNPFAFAALNRPLVEKVGLFDEWTFFPAYFEDNDYGRRMHLNGIGLTYVPAAVYHGDAEGPEHGSVTIRSDGRYRNANNRTFVENASRYRDKWGGHVNNETLSTPWGFDVPLTYLEIDLRGRARRSW